jgi:ferrochelatase
MSRFQPEPSYRHGQQAPLGVLITNLGTPDAPTPKALRRYLAEFLWDPRVVELPRPLWWLILHGAILRIRPRRAAKAYQSIWTEEGSPLLVHARAQAAALATALPTRLAGPVRVALGMRYGTPSIPQALDELKQAGSERLLVLPLYPQFSASTTASTLDAVGQVLRRMRRVPELRFIAQYHDHPAYIAALAQSVRDHRDQHGQAERLMFSFHGIPRRYFLQGDPYHCQCHKTARLVAETLGLAEGQWQVCFQSRFGREEWLKPYTDHSLQALPKQGVKSVQVICPGFSADCLETLEEIAEQNKAFFLEAGGERFGYIPALNERRDHIDALIEIIEQHLQGWPGVAEDWDREADEAARAASRERALALGATD